jgi:hypothetical protein
MIAAKDGLITLKKRLIGNKFMNIKNEYYQEEIAAEDRLRFQDIKNNNLISAEMSGINTWSPISRAA